jgi:hydrogenase maturation factor HypE
MTHLRFSAFPWSGFFGQKTDVREFLAEGSYQERFNLVIDISHEVDVTLVGYLLDLPGVIIEMSACALDYAGSGIERRNYFFLPL